MFTLYSVGIAVVIAVAFWIILTVMTHERLFRETYSAGGWVAFRSDPQGIRVTTSVAKPEGPDLLYCFHTEELMNEATLITMELKDFHISKSTFDREATLMYIDSLGSE